MILLAASVHRSKKARLNLEMAVIAGVLPLPVELTKALGNKSWRGGCVLLQQQDADRLFLNNIAKC